jgi:hypothetical protein
MATFTLDLLTGQEHLFSFSGLKGDKGDPGASGVTTIIYSGLTVFSGVSPTVVTTSYSGQTQIISIYTPSGATGAQGLQGVSGATGPKGDSGQTIVNYYTFIPSGGTLISVGSGNTVVIYSPTGATGGFTGYTFIASGSTQISVNGNYVTIYSTPATGTTATWSTLTGKPAWLTGTTLQQFEAGHGHDQYSLTGHTHSQYLTGVTWNNVTGKPNLTLQSDFSIHTGDTTIHYVQSAITITESQVINLVSDLAGKSNTGHTHNQYLTISAFTAYSGSTFTGYTFVESGGTQIFQNGNIITIYSVVPSGSTVAWNDVTGKPNLTLQSDFSSHTGNTTIHYAQSAITITESQVINLVSDLASKSNTGHTHSYTGSTITDKPDLSIYTPLTTFGDYTGDTLTTLTLLGNSTGNGVISGFTITQHPPLSASTTIDISSGLGYIVDNHTDPSKPIVTRINYPGQTGITLTYRTTNLVTYLAVDSGGTIVQQVSQFSMSQRRDYILLGAVIHSNLLYVNAINNLPDVLLDANTQLNDLLDSLRNFNVEGNKISYNGPNLQIDKTVGKIFKRGVNFNIDNTNPHVKTTAALTAPSNIRYRLSNSTEYADTNSIDVVYYESPLGTRTIVTNNYFTIQRIVLFASNLLRIQYGQAEYKTLAEAQQAIYSEQFTFEQNIKENGLLRGLLIVQEGAVDLSNAAQALFIEVDKFGTMSLGGGGGSVWGGISGTLSDQTDLQAALNSKSNTGHTHSYTGSTITNKPTFVGSGGTTVSLVGNQYRIYSSTGSTGGFTGYTFIESGGTQIFQNGNIVTIYSTVPSGSTVYWNDILNKPNLTLQSDFSAHTGQTGSGSIHFTGHTFTQSGITIITQIGDNVNIYVPPDSISAVTWTNVTNKPAWITGNTAAQFASGHTHPQYLTGVTWSTITNKPDLITGLTSLVAFQLKDISGGTEVNNITNTSIGWTTLEYSGSSVNYTGGSRIYITTNGTYGISYTLNVISQTNTSKNIGTAIRKNNNTIITPTTSTSSMINTTNNRGTNLMPEYQVDLTNGDYLELIAFRIGGTGSVLTQANGSWLTVLKRR